MKRGTLNLNSADLRLDIQIRILFSGSVSQPVDQAVVVVVLSATTSSVPVSVSDY